MGSSKLIMFYYIYIEFINNPTHNSSTTSTIINDNYPPQLLPISFLLLTQKLVYIIKNKDEINNQ